ncbi:MAG: TonB family protein [Candidatus Omnitrophota bacterium]
MLQIALLISLTAHAAIIFNSRVLPFIKPPEAEHKTKVSYIKIKNSPKEAIEPKDKENRLLKRIPPPYIEMESLGKENNAAKPRDVQSPKPELIKQSMNVAKRKIVLPPVDMAKIDNPSYISYYQIVREKIRRSAYQNYTRSETGEVYVAFIISGDGDLKNARLVEERSSGNSYLKSIALASVKSASPFPRFPKELDYPELSFNVVISFEIE